MRAGINVWTWGTERKALFEQALKEVSDIGYQAVENICTIGDLYADSPGEFDALLGRYGVEFVCGYLHLTDDDLADDRRAERCVRFLQQHGAEVMNIQAGTRPEGVPSQADLKATAAKVARYSQWAREAGIVPCLHPHYDTIIEREDELAYMMQNLAPDLLSLTLDTAHTVLGGMDPVATFTRYAKRVGYVHMKDIAPARDPSAPWYSSFRELGRGTVDLVGVVGVLRAAGFSGVLCVELDQPRICGYKSAAVSRQYMHDELGL
jgi:inosose dehydratase